MIKNSELNKISQMATQIDRYMQVTSQYTMVGPERVANLITQLRYCKEQQISGCLVECGVWAGGMVCLMKAVANEFGLARNVYAFDSFEGLPPPSDIDVDHVGCTGRDQYQAADRKFCYAPLTSMQRCMAQLGLKDADIIVKKGWFEETTRNFPEDIAILRLDGDWYKSTIDCLNNLYDRVVPGGCIIIDDYGHWLGCRKATDDFLRARGIPGSVLHQTDYTEVYFYKPGRAKENSASL